VQLFRQTPQTASQASPQYPSSHKHDCDINDKEKEKLCASSPPTIPQSINQSMQIIWRMNKAFKKCKKKKISCSAVVECEGKAIHPVRSVVENIVWTAFSVTRAIVQTGVCETTTKQREEKKAAKINKSMNKMKRVSCDEWDKFGIRSTI
jgi:hypothetical protein